MRMFLRVKRKRECGKTTQGLTEENFGRSAFNFAYSAALRPHRQQQTIAEEEKNWL